MNFISALWFDTGAIPINTPMGQPTGGESTSIYLSYVQGITGLSGGLSALWLILAGVGGGAALVLSGISGQTTPFAVFIFGEVFWTSWIRSFAALGSYVPSEISLLFTIPVVLIFVGAVVGILGYSG